MIISSLDNPKVKLLSKLNKSKTRYENNMFVVEGSHLVKEARLAGMLIEAYSLEEKEGYITLSEAVMKKISNTDTVVTELGLCKMNDKHELSSKLLLLDGVQDPGNMGTIMRSARAFGFNTIILGDGCVDIYNDKVIRSSQGAIFKLNFIKTNLKDFILNHPEYDIYGTDVTNGIKMEDVTKKDNIGIVLGNEGNGMSEETRSALKKNIYIELSNTESLNVGVAGGIIMYYFK